VVPHALSFSFGLVAEGTLVEGAELQLESVPAIGRCRGCAAETELQDFPFQCAACGGIDLQIVAGDELMVESIEIEEADVELYSH
jgi:hydrogenase nickel incorporation protein HypA/HybF